MDINDVFQSETIKAADLKGQEHERCIATVERKDFENGPKLIITFQGGKKAFVCNRTNSKRIAAAYGNDTRGWIGKVIILYPELVQFQNGMVESVRVRTPLKRAPVAAQPRNGVELSTGTEAHPNAPGNDSQANWNPQGDDIPF